MFTEINALPGAQIQSTSRNRDRQAAADEDRFDVRRHVVRPFIVVGIVGGVFRDKLIKVRFQVSAHFRLHIFVEGQRGRGVLDKEVGDAGSWRTISSVTR